MPISKGRSSGGFRSSSSGHKSSFSSVSRNKSSGTSVTRTTSSFSSATKNKSSFTSAKRNKSSFTSGKKNKSSVASTTWNKTHGYYNGFSHHHTFGIHNTYMNHQNHVLHHNSFNRKKNNRPGQRGLFRHHHSNSGGSADCDCNCCCCCIDNIQVVYANPYAGNPNVVSLIWDRNLHGFDENSPKLAKMIEEQYDPEPVKRIVAELNALSRSMNFRDQPPEPNVYLIMLFTILGFFPVIFYLLWLQNKTLDYLEGENNFRQASQAILMKHNEVLTRSSRYFLEAGENYPYVLAIHLMRENQMGGDPSNPQMTMNTQQTLVNNPNMMMLAPQLRLNQNAMNNQMMMNGPQMMVNQNGIEQMIMVDQGQPNFQNYNP